MSRLSRFASLAVMAFAAFHASYVTPAFDFLAYAARRAADFAFGAVLHVAAKCGKELVQRPLVTIVSAKDRVLRLIKRDAPRIEGSWRMCPSV